MSSHIRHAQNLGSALRYVVARIPRFGFCKVCLAPTRVLSQLRNRALPLGVHCYYFSYSDLDLSKHCELGTK